MGEVSRTPTQTLGNNPLGSTDIRDAERHRFEDGHYLAVLSTPGLDRHLLLPIKTGTFTVGRRHSVAVAEAGLTLIDERVSRYHFRIRRTHAGPTIEDRSRNGTLLNGRRLPEGVPLPLESGAVIRVGDSIFVFGEGYASSNHEDNDLIVGMNPAVVALRKRVRVLAKQASVVLILGETGTGKEYTARAIHQWGDRADRGYVEVNCGDIEGSVGRAELFGAEKGAFTDAEDRTGIVKSLGSGVLFLDEIGDLELENQRIFIPFLDKDQRYRPVGANRSLKSKARIVAATNVDLDKAADANRFRRDLLARLRSNAVPLELPPLRHRKDDILLWSRHLLTVDYGSKVGQIPFDAGFIECLLLDDFVENLRGLRSALRSALEKAGDAKTLTAKHLPRAFRDRRRVARLAEPSAGSTTSESGEIFITPTASGGPAVSAEPEPPRQVRSQKVAPTPDEIRDALQLSRGVVSAASVALNVERTKLYRLMKVFGIVASDYRDTDAQGPIDPDLGIDL